MPVHVGVFLRLSSFPSYQHHHVPAELAPHAQTVERIKGVLLGAVRKSWEQGAAANAILELEYPELSLFGPGDPSVSLSSGVVPWEVLQLALSAVYLQGEDGRLSQKIGSGTDGAALDGASAGIAVLIGTRTESSRKDFWQTAADAQLNYILNTAPRLKSGAISHRATEREYWSDAIYMGPPFLAFSALLNSESDSSLELARLAIEHCRLYRSVLRSEESGTWRHIFSDDVDAFRDNGCWATGNAWAALGMVLVRRAVELSSFKAQFEEECKDLGTWTREILDGALQVITPDDLIPNYLEAPPSGTAAFSDAASSAGLIACAYRCLTFWPDEFEYPAYPGLGTIARVRDAVIRGVDAMGLMSPVVDPLGITPEDVGLLSPEAQAFGIMMFAAWRDFVQVRGSVE